MPSRGAMPASNKKNPGKPAGKENLASLWRHTSWWFSCFGHLAIVNHFWMLSFQHLDIRFLPFLWIGYGKYFFSINNTRMRATLLILKKSQILLIHRFYFWKEYYVFPWWWIESGETPEQAAIRELLEETSLVPNSIQFLFQHKDEFDSRTQYVYRINDFTGIPTIGWPEKQEESENNQYILEWHDIDKIEHLLLYPEWIHRKILANPSIIQIPK